MQIGTYLMNNNNSHVILRPFLDQWPTIIYEEPVQLTNPHSSVWPLKSIRRKILISNRRPQDKSILHSSYFRASSCPARAHPLRCASNWSNAQTAEFNRIFKMRACTLLSISSRSMAEITADYAKFQLWTLRINDHSWVSRKVKPNWIRWNEEVSLSHLLSFAGVMHKVLLFTTLGECQ